MLCYRDMTFCPFWKDCGAGQHCPRAQTDVHVRRAEELKLPFCLFVDKPKCFALKETEED